MQKPFIITHRWTFIFVLFLLIAAGLRFLGPYSADLRSWLEFGVSAEEKARADAEMWALEEEALRNTTSENAEEEEAIVSQEENALETLRKEAQASVKEGDPQGLTLAYKLFREPDATPQDRSWALSLALDNRDMSNAIRLASLLTPTDLNDPAVHYQLIRGFLVTGKLQEAIKLADDPRRTSRDPRVDLLLAGALVRSNDKATQDAATARLETLLRSEDDTLALSAMTVISLSKEQSTRNFLVQSALNRVENVQNLKVADDLNREYLRIVSGKRNQSVAVNEAAEKYGESDFQELLPWMFRLGQYQRVVDSTEAKEMKSDPKIFNLRIRALEILKRWDQIDSDLSHPGVAMAIPSLRITQAMVSFRLGDKVKARQRWLVAREAVRLDQNQNWFSQLASAARNLGNIDDQMESIIEGIKHSVVMKVDTQMLMALTKWMRNREDGERLLEVYAILLRIQPDHRFLQNNNAYLKALYGYTTESDVNVMRQIVSRFPGESAIRNTLGFVLLSLGDAEACLETLNQVPSSPKGLTDFGKAVYARALYDLKRKKEALDLGKLINWGQLSRDELKKLALPMGR